MATNKNQHYVPQCYLSQFAMKGTKSAINLFNLDKIKFIKCAPIKNQCSKNYFYGKDLVIEKALQPIEGEYSKVIKEIKSEKYKLNEEHKLFLKRFWLLQNLRTESTSRKYVELTESMGETNKPDPKIFKMEMEEAVRLSLNLYSKQKHIVDDLNVCLIKNNSDIDFITSDDPAILTNRWHLQNKRVEKESFGLGNAGIIFLLPLTRDILCFGYDSDVYSIPHKNGWIKVSSREDVKYINQHQILNCRANVFTGNDDSSELLKNMYVECAQNKPKETHKIRYAALIDENEYEKTYEAVEKEEVEDRRAELMHCQRVYPNPTGWPRFLRWRNRAFAFDNGSAAGYIRRKMATSMASEGFEKVLLSSV